MLQALVFYIFVWWFKTIENRKALIVRSILASIFAIIYWICALCMLVVDDIPIAVSIIMFIPAILFTIRAVTDIKKLYCGNTNSTNENETNKNKPSNKNEYRGYLSKYTNPKSKNDDKEQKQWIIKNVRNAN